MEALLNRRWIRKAEDKELYYKIRDSWERSENLQRKKWAVP